MIFQICDKISEVLLEQYSMHKDISNSPFDKGLVMKLQYRINRSAQKTSRKKYKGGARAFPNFFFLDKVSEKKNF